MSSANERILDIHSTWDRPHPESVFATLVHASIVDGAVAAIKVLTVVYLLDLAFTPAVAVGGLVAFAIYASNKLVDDEDEINAPKRAAFVARYRTPLAVATGVGIVLALALAATAGPIAFSLTVLPGVAAVAYSVDVPVFERRLKDVLVLNNLVVSVSWALPVVALPIVWANGHLTPLAAVVFLFYFAQTLVAFEVRNVRDVAGDRTEGVDTIPVVYGVDNTRLILYGIDLLAISLYVTAATTGILPLAVAAVFVLASLVSMLVTRFVDRGYDDGRICLLRDANYALVFVVVALAA